MLAIATALVVFIAYYVFNFYEKVKKYPPGPTPFPLIGNLLSVDYHRMHEYMDDLSKVYGSVYTLWLPRPFVVITDLNLIKDAFQKEEFSGRLGTFPDTTFQSTANGGVIFAQGEAWKEQRRTSVHILRDFGMGRNLMEEKVALSVENFMEIMKTHEKEGKVDFRWPIQILIGNIINEVLYGFTYRYDECDRLFEFIDRFNWHLREMRASNLNLFAQTFSWFKHLPYLGYRAVGRFEENTREMKNTVLEDVKRALKNYDVTKEPECFVQAYYQKMKTTSHSTLSEDQMINVCMDFFLAGSETTSSTLRWAMLYMAKNQHVQDKLRQEIHSVIGTERMATMNDKSSMPYASATIQELQRHANIVNLNIIHRTTADTHIGKHPIPEDTMVWGQIWSVMRNSTVFKETDEFRPERFLKTGGMTPVKETNDNVIPYSVGKRQCVGEGLARVELFLGLVSIIQHYKIEGLDGKEINVTPLLAALQLPPRQTLKITRVTA